MVISKALANADRITFLTTLQSVLCTCGSSIRGVVDDAILANAIYVEPTSRSPCNLSCAEGTRPPENARKMHS